MSSPGAASDIDWKALTAVATAARAHAYAPYSRFPVGAAVLTADGAIYGGCNVENRSFGLTTCAERVAVGSAIAAGSRGLEAVVVVTDTEPPAPPCGLCRETLAEFAGGDLPILLVGASGKEQRYRLDELFPHPFEFPPPEE